MISMTRLGKDGQLGNQLFQYALLRAISEKTGYEMAIPKNYTGEKKNGLVELSPFAIEAPALPAGTTFANTFKYERVKYNPDVFSQPDGTDYVGWYQSEKYFADIAPTIRREFRFNSQITSTVSTFIDELKADRPKPPMIISLHVRRGDYLEYSDKFRVLTPAYYQTALAKIHNYSTYTANDPLPIVLVFSDDIPWCRANLFLQDVQIVFFTSPSHWHDMCAMSMCDHHVMSASSFSWWGAWLNPNPSKIVIAPKPWFGSGLPEDTTDLIPDSWTQLETMEGYK